jgi:hypothetical protein
MADQLTTLACSGHVLLDLPVFMGPVVLLVGWLLFVTRRDRRREAAEGAETGGGAEAGGGAKARGGAEARELGASAA